MVQQPAPRKWHGTPGFMSCPSMVPSTQPSQHAVQVPHSRRALMSLRLASAITAPQHFLYFLPLPQGHGSLRPTRMLRPPVYAVPIRRISFAIAERAARAANARAVKSRGPLCKNFVHESGTEPALDPHRPGHADGAALPPLLAAGAARRRAATARLPAGTREDPRRASHRVSRYAEPPRADRRILRTPRRVALVRAQRRKRAQMLVSRLEVRHHRPVRGDSLRAEQSQALPAHEAEGLSADRARRRAVDLHGTGGGEAAAARARMGDGAGGEPLRLQ